MWCHILLMMPLLGLGMFVLLPWPTALSLYVAVVAASLFMYAKIMQGMRRAVQTGQEAMVGAVVTVTREGFPQGGQVRYHNELWSAVFSQPLSPGEQGRIVGLEGMRLVVRPADDGWRKGKHERSRDRRRYDQWLKIRCVA